MACPKPNEQRAAELLEYFIRVAAHEAVDMQIEQRDAAIAYASVYEPKHFAFNNNGTTTVIPSKSQKFIAFLAAASKQAKEFLQSVGGRINTEFPPDIPDGYAMFNDPIVICFIVAYSWAADSALQENVSRVVQELKPLWHLVVMYCVTKEQCQRQQEQENAWPDFFVKAVNNENHEQRRSLLQTFWCHKLPKNYRATCSIKDFASLRNGERVVTHTIKVLFDVDSDYEQFVNTALLNDYPFYSHTGVENKPLRVMGKGSIQQVVMLIVWYISVGHPFRKSKSWQTIRDTLAAVQRICSASSLQDRVIS